MLSVTSKTFACSYQDRAAERRKADGQLDAEERLYESIDIEKSKFLGGDEEHTHLVKGLDVALLRRVRAEQERADAAERAAAERRDANTKKAELAASAAFRTNSGGYSALHAAAAGAAAAAVSGSVDPEATFRTAVGRRLQDIVTSQRFQDAQNSVYGVGAGSGVGAAGAAAPGSNVSRDVGRALSAALGLEGTMGQSRWAEGRTSYCFNISWDGDSGVPSTLMRSAEDCPPPSAGVVDVVDERVRGPMVAALMGPGKRSSSRGRALPSTAMSLKAQQARSAELAADSDSSDDGIFAGVGTYAPLAAVDAAAGADTGDAAEQHDAGPEPGQLERAEAAFKAAFAQEVVDVGGEGGGDEDLMDESGRLKGLSSSVQYEDAGYGFGEMFAGDGGGDEDEDEGVEGGPKGKRRRDESDADRAKREAQRKQQKEQNKFDKDFRTVNELVAEKAAKKARKG